MKWFLPILSSMVLFAGCAADADDAFVASSNAPETTVQPLQHMDLGPLALDVPASWSRQPGDQASSTELHFGHISSAAPLSQAGVDLRWTESGFMRGPLVAIPNPDRMIGGYPARVTTVAGGDCHGRGGAETITAEVIIPPDADYTMTACLGPEDMHANERELQRMLDSVTFAP